MCLGVNRRFHYGSPSDYDEWSEVLGESLETSSWSYKNLHKYVQVTTRLCRLIDLWRYFLKFEKFVPHNEFAGVDLVFRGSSGPVESEPFLLEVHHKIDSN